MCVCALVFSCNLPVIMVEQYIAFLISWKLFVTQYVSISTEFYVCIIVRMPFSHSAWGVSVWMCLMQISRMQRTIVLTMLSFHEIGQNTIAISIQVNRYSIHWNVLLCIAHSTMAWCKVFCACYMDAKWMLTKNETTKCIAMQCHACECLYECVRGWEWVDEFLRKIVCRIKWNQATGARILQCISKVFGNWQGTPQKEHGFESEIMQQCCQRTKEKEQKKTQSILNTVI